MEYEPIDATIVLKLWLFFERQKEWLTYLLWCLKDLEKVQYFELEKDNVVTIHKTCVLTIVDPFSWPK